MAATTGERLNRQDHRSKPENKELEAVMSKAKSNQAMKLVAKSQADARRITKTIDEKEYEERVAYRKLYSLESEESGFRLKRSLAGKRIASLKRELDKLTFANNAYKDRSISTQDKLNLHNLHFHMHHGTDHNMAKEKKLLKEANACKKNSKDGCDSDQSVVDRINYRIWTLKMSIPNRMNYFIPRQAITVDENEMKVLKEINELKWQREKAFANAPVKEKIWNSLPPKNVIKQKIKELEEVLDDEYRKKYMPVRGEIEVMRRQINRMKNNIASIKRQLLDVGMVEKAAKKFIKEARKIIHEQKTRSI